MLTIGMPTLELGIWTNSWRSRWGKTLHKFILDNEIDFCKVLPHLLCMHNQMKSSMILAEGKHLPSLVHQCMHNQRGKTLPSLAHQCMHNQMHSNIARGNTSPSLVHQCMHNSNHATCTHSIFCCVCTGNCVALCCIVVGSSTSPQVCLTPASHAWHGGRSVCGEN